MWFRRDPGSEPARGQLKRTSKKGEQDFFKTKGYTGNDMGGGVKGTDQSSNSHWKWVQLPSVLKKQPKKEDHTIESDHRVAVNMGLLITEKWKKSFKSASIKNLTPEGGGGVEVETR